MVDNPSASPLKRMLQRWFFARSIVNAAHARGIPIGEYSRLWFDSQELLGLQPSGAPINKLLQAILKQAIDAGARFISFEDGENVSVWFSANKLEDDRTEGATEAMRMPRNLLEPLVYHALARSSYKDEKYQRILSMIGWQHELPFQALSGRIPKFRCGLREPADIASLLIELVDTEKPWPRPNWQRIRSLESTKLLAENE